MTDLTTSDRAPRVTICPDCSAMLPHTPAAMQNHRGFHRDLERKHEGIRQRLRDQDATIASNAAAVTDVRRDLDNTEIPEPVAPLDIDPAEDDWADLEDPQDDENPPDDDNDLDDLDDSAEPVEARWETPGTATVHPIGGYRP